MPATRTVPSELELELLRLFESDVSMGRLANEYGLKRQAVSQKIRFAYAYVYGQVPKRLERPSTAQQQKQQAAIHLYLDAVPRKDIQRRVHISARTLNRIIVDAGLPARICRQCKGSAPVTSALCSACRSANRSGASAHPDLTAQSVADGPLAPKEE